MLRPPQGLNRWRARGQGVRRAALNQPVKAGQRRAQASTIAQIKITTAVMGAMVARRQQRLKLPRPDATATQAQTRKLTLQGRPGPSKGAQLQRVTTCTVRVQPAQALPPLNRCPPYPGGLFVDRRRTSVADSRSGLQVHDRAVAISGRTHVRQLSRSTRPCAPAGRQG